MKSYEKPVCEAVRFTESDVAAVLTASKLGNCVADAGGNSSWCTGYDECRDAASLGCNMWALMDESGCP